MQIFFKTRAQVRNSKINAKMVDNGVKSEIGKRWAIDCSEQIKR